MATIPKITLDEWQKAVLPWLRKCEFAPSKLSNATLLSYFFWDDDRIETKFYTVECAFLCAFHSWGAGMPATIVTNRETKAMRDFCAQHSVRLQIDPELKGGVPGMNIDCIRNLHSRFATEYVVVLQSDGMPVKAGLEEFVGEWDYVGAPWAGHGNWKDWFVYPRFAVGNGGFCIRSKRICEAASKAYAPFWSHLPYSLLVGDDIFYCKTMPFLSRKWRKTFQYPSREEALRFAVEHIPQGLELTVPPIGFHSEAGFRNYVRHFGVPFAEKVGL
jgi:hypothetical protein